MKGVQTTDVKDENDIRSFFDQIAEKYSEQNGRPDPDFDSRVKLLRKELKLTGKEHLVEICCGPGFYLIALADQIMHGTGIDFSPEMIRIANDSIANTCIGKKLTFNVDDATQIRSIKNGSADAVFCIGSLEHIPDKLSVFTAVKNILKPEGRFVCFTLNGGYLWYKKIAPFLRIKTHYLSTDHFITKLEAEVLIRQSGLTLVEPIHYWSFIPKSDMTPFQENLFNCLDKLGQILGISQFRGGIRFHVKKLE